MTAKKALIHIGGNKTGSTAIQSELFAAAARNTLGGACYPELDPVSKCQHFLDVFYGDDKSTFPHLRAFADRFCIDTTALHRKYLATLQKAGNLVLSSEALSDFTEDRVRLFKRDLDAAGYADYKIVLYVREPVSHYVSFLQEILKQRRVCAQPSWHNYLGHMRQAIDVFSDVFGSGVCVREFDRKKLVGGDVVLDFAAIASDFFGTDITLLSGQANESLTAEAAFIVHEYRSSPPYSESDDRIMPPEVNFLVQQLQRLSARAHTGTKIVLRDEVAACIAGQNVEDAAWFKQQYGIDFSTHAVSADSSDLDEPLRLEEIIVKPADESIDQLRKMIHFVPLAAPTSRRPDYEAYLREFVQDKKYRRKVVYGGGSVFHDLIGKLWLFHNDVRFDGVVFVDRTPGPKRIKRWTFSFVHPEEVDWGTVDAALICTPAYDAEIREYLQSRNGELLVHSLGGEAINKPG